jgi:hypothetical protein
VNPSARLASTSITPGPSRTDAGRAALIPAVSACANGTSARSATAIRTGFAAAITASALAVLLALSATPAHATTGHGLAGSFGGPGTEEGQFSGGPTGVGVGLAGDVFASDPGGSRIEHFNAAGTFQSAFPVNPAEFLSVGAVAVDSAAAGGEYVAVGNATTGVPEVAKYSAAGAFEYVLNPAGSETTINYGVLAVDPSSGTVYTTATKSETSAEPFAQVIDSFDQKTGAFIASFNGSSGSPDGGFACPTGLAADNAKHVYVLDPCKNRVDRYSSAGAWEATVDDGSRGAPAAVATDPKTDELFVAESGPLGLQVTDFSAGGASVVHTFPAAGNAGLAGFAVGPDDTVYAGDIANSVIDRFSAFEGPTVASEAASEVEPTSVTFNGTIDPNGTAAKYHYQYGVETSYGSTTAEEDAGSGSGAVPAPAAVTGLVPNTTYHYRILGTNAAAFGEDLSFLGEDETFTTVAIPPVVDGSPTFVTPITPTGARVHATVNPEHSPATFRIEYGTTSAYGSTAPEGGAEVGEQSSDTAVATNLSGLEPGTLYHYRVSAENGVGGPQAGADGTFITAPAAPATGDEVTTRKATLTGTIDPHGAATTYHFTYGPSTAYGASTPEMDGGSGNVERGVSEHITGLAPGTTYHVQVVATTNGLTHSGADGAFTTAAAPAATVSDPASVTTSSAMLRGATDTHGLAGSYHFEVSATEGSFATSTAEQPLPAVTGAQPLSSPISGLPSGQGLQVRLVVTSNEATDVSKPAFFSTAPPPPEGFPAPPSPGSGYGCTAPKLNPVNGRIKPGSSITVTGSDLGLIGRVLLGEHTLIPTDWSATGFTIAVPPDVAGTLGLTVNCRLASNTVAVATTGEPSNTFSVGKVSVKGTTATVSVTLPGPGKLQLSGPRTRAATTTVPTAGTQTIRVALSATGLKALRKAKHRTLAVKVQLRFTPTGGQPASRTAAFTFKRKGGR